jgi:hypothetical protein
MAVTVCFQESKFQQSCHSLVLGKGYCVVISDANFRRYNIRPRQLKQMIDDARRRRVALHFVFIGDLDNEADDVVAQLPRNTGHVCRETTELPDILRKILLASIRE